MTATLRISPDLRLPLEAVTETFAVLAKRGAGKTYTGAVMAEEMLDARQQIVVVDPLDVWFGLRSSADGHGDGYPIHVFGGDHADVPLEAGAGELVADFAIDHGISLILSLKGFRRGEARRFMLAFLERLYRRNREPLHLFVDEADLFAPQRVTGGPEVAQLQAAMEDVVRRGRANGIGVTLITQRSAVLSKDVLTQAEVLIALRTTHPRDREAIREWVKVHGDPDRLAELESELAALPIGDAYIWSPGWLDVFRRVRIRERRTFDSSATPKPGERRREPKRLAPVDLEALRGRMAATIERAKADDPRELRRQIAGLERELAKRLKEVETVVERVEVPVIPDVQLQLLEEMAKTLRDVVAAAGAVADQVSEATRTVRAAEGRADGRTDGRAARTPAPRAPRDRPAPRRDREAPRRPAPREDGEVRDAAASDLSRSQQRILDALAWFEALEIEAPSRVALAFIAGTRPTSGGFKNNLGALRSAGLVDYPQSNHVELTDGGRALAVPPAIAPTDEALQDAVLERVTGSQASILRTLIDAYPDSLSREELAEAVRVPVTSGGFKNNLGALRTLELIDYPGPGYVVALPVLFPTRAGAIA